MTCAPPIFDGLNELQKKFLWNKDELFLIHARNRFLYGQRLEQSPAPFLKEIPKELMKDTTIPDRPRKAKKEQQAGLF